MYIEFGFVPVSGYIYYWLLCKTYMVHGMIKIIYKTIDFHKVDLYSFFVPFLLPIDAFLL